MTQKVERAHLAAAMVAINIRIVRHVAVMTTLVPILY